MAQQGLTDEQMDAQFGEIPSAQPQGLSDEQMDAQFGSPSSQEPQDLGVLNAVGEGLARGAIGERGLSDVTGVGQTAKDVLMNPSLITDPERMKQLYRQYQQASLAQSELSGEQHPIATGIGMGGAILGMIANPLLGGAKAVQAAEAAPQAMNLAAKVARIGQAAIKPAAIAGGASAVLGSANSPNNLIGPDANVAANLKDAGKSGLIGTILGGTLGAGGQTVNEVMASKAAQKVAPTITGAYNAGAEGENLIGSNAVDTANQSVEDVQDQAKETADNINDSNKQQVKDAKAQNDINEDNAQGQGNQQLFNAAQQAQQAIESELGERGNAYQAVNQQNAGKTINQVNSELANSTEGRDPSDVKDIDNFDDFNKQFQEGLENLNSDNDKYLSNDVNNVVEGPTRSKQVTTYQTKYTPGEPGTLQEMNDKGQLAVANAQQQGIKASFNITPGQTADGQRTLNLNIVREQPPTGIEGSVPNSTVSSAFEQPPIPESTETIPITKIQKTREGGTLDPSYEQLRQLRTNLRALKTDQTLTNADRNFINDQYSKLTSLMQDKFPGLQQADAGYAAGAKFQDEIGNNLNNAASLAKQGESANLQGSSLADIARSDKFQSNLASIRKFNPQLADQIQGMFQQTVQNNRQILNATQMQGQSIIDNINNQTQQQLQQAEQSSEQQLSQALQKQQLVQNVNAPVLKKAGVGAGIGAGVGSAILPGPGTALGAKVGGIIGGLPPALGRVANVAGRLSTTNIPRNLAVASSAYAGLQSLPGEKTAENPIPSPWQTELQPASSKSGPSSQQATRISANIYNTPKPQLRQVGVLLTQHPQTKFIGDSLVKAIDANDSQGITRASFLISQTPQASEIFNSSTLRKK